MLRLVETIGKVPENYIRNRFGLARIRYQNGWNYVMNLVRTTAGINKAEDAGGWTPPNQVRRCVAAVFPDGGQLFPVSWLDLPGDLVRLRFSNI